jgi:hypothetical protein
VEPLTNIAGSIPKEVDCHLVSILLSQHLLPVLYLECSAQANWDTLSNEGKTTKLQHSSGIFRIPLVSRAL